MLRQLPAYEPWFAHLFGIRPWEIERLTWLQLCTFRDAVDDYIRASQKGR